MSQIIFPVLFLTWLTIANLNAHMTRLQNLLEKKVAIVLKITPSVYKNWFNILYTSFWLSLALVHSSHEHCLSSFSNKMLPWTTGFATALDCTAFCINRCILLHKASFMFILSHPVLHPVLLHAVQNVFSVMIHASSSLCFSSSLWP